MIHAFGWHGSVFIDTVGHCAGVFLFGLLVLLLLRDWRLKNHLQNKLSLIAALLVLLWNISELIVLGTPGISQAAGRPATSISLFCLSILPAVLLHISLGNRLKTLALAGYALSAIAIVLEYMNGEAFRTERSRLSLLVLSFGFALLSVGAWLWAEYDVKRKASTAKPNRVAFLSLFIFATSFLHFQAGHTSEVWVGEAIWHHAAIPIALIVLLQDYRFLLLDVFLRFAASAFWIALWLWVLETLNEKLNLRAVADRSDFYRGLLLTSLGFVIYLLARSLRHIQQLLTVSAFRRPPLDPLLRSLQSTVGLTESSLLEQAAGKLAEYYQCERFAILRDQSTPERDDFSPAVMDPLRHRSSRDPEWAMVALSIRSSRGGRCRLFLGPRAGGRRFLSEDLLTLQRIQSVLIESLERFRNEEMLRAVNEADLRALQAQINPHFLFNVLNTLYGTIGRGSPDARRLVLNLAEIFRARLQSTRMYVPLSEELDLVRAYLEIEAVRLGERLKTEIQIEADPASIMIPILTIQPLVENAVKHGMSSTGDVVLTLRVALSNEALHVSVQDNGRGFAPNGQSHGPGVGLGNVRKRLRLCYGAEADLQIDSNGSGSKVSFAVPIPITPQVLHSELAMK